MATPSMPQAQRWFEHRFKEVHIYDPATHPQGLPASQCPNGAAYVTIIDGQLTLEGEPAPTLIPESEAIQKWFASACALHDLMGRPGYLWWRELPQFVDGRIYSRFILTQSGPYRSYTGRPVSLAA